VLFNLALPFFFLFSFFRQFFLPLFVLVVGLGQVDYPFPG